MNKQVLEFWGNALIHMAKSQEQLEAMTRLMDQGMKTGLGGMEAWPAFFTGFFGLGSKAEEKKNSPAGEATANRIPGWGIPMEDLQASINWFCDLMGFVPKQEHVRVLQKYEALKQRSADQEETIRHLRLMQREGNADQSTLVKDFQRMIAEQTEQFQELMKNSEKFFHYAASTSKPPDRE
ncbi:MAG: hypothetical protein ACOZF0_04395 [Thermodesulfobacteriota bacterium]